MAAKKRPSLKELSDQVIVERVQSILINAAEGRRSVGDDAQYDKLRRELIRRPFSTPPLVSIHPSVDSFSAFIRGIADRRERVVKVRQDFEAALRPEDDTPGLTFDSSTWGAPPSQSSRLRTVRSYCRWRRPLWTA